MVILSVIKFIIYLLYIVLPDIQGAMCKQLKIIFLKILRYINLVYFHM